MGHVVNIAEDANFREDLDRLDPETVIWDRVTARRFIEGQDKYAQREGGLCNRQSQVETVVQAHQTFM